MIPTLHMAAVLCCCLGADSFGAREQAHAALTDLLPVSAPYLEVAAARAPVLEARMRARQILGGYRQRTARGKAALLLLGRGNLPWVDQAPEWFTSWPCYRRYPDQAYWESVATVRPGWGHYLAMAQYHHRRAYLPVGAPDWPEYRLGTYYLMEDLYLDGWSRGQVDILLADMAAGEAWWKKRNGGFKGY